jgi:two-component system response regulator YesN
LQTVSDAMGLTAPYFSQLFSRETGQGVNAYITGLRMEFAGRLLSSSDLKVDDIAAQTGFSSASYFNLVFKKTFGMTPTQYRKKTQTS